MLPWIEKYRPSDLSQIELDSITKNMFMTMIERQVFPHLLFYGPPGTGKTTTIMCLIKEYQKSYGRHNNIIHLNASDDRGVEIIRNQLYTFIHSKGLFYQELKFIILDEVDSMTKQAQQSLLTLMELPHVRFCLICNYISKLIQPLRDYLLIVPFYNTMKERTSIRNIILKESVTIDENSIDDIVYNYYPDMRSILNCLQIYHTTPYEIIQKSVIHSTCEEYDRETIMKYITRVSFKDFLVRLFIHMLNYNIDSSLVTMMKQQLLVKTDFDYFDKIFIPYFKLLQNN